MSGKKFPFLTPSRKRRRKDILTFTRSRMAWEKKMTTLTKAKYQSSTTRCPKLCSTDPSSNRRLLRVLVTLSFGAACCYQVHHFLKMYLTYPTVVGVDVELIESSVMPAITICNKNLLRRGQVCMNMKNLCQNWSNAEDFSTKLYETVDVINTTALRNVGHQAEKLFNNCIAEVEGNETLVDFTASCRNATWVYNGKQSCFLINQQWSNNGDNPFLRQENIVAFMFTLDLEVQEYLWLGDGPSANIYLHSPVNIPTSSMTGFEAHAHTSYTVGFTKTTLRLLEPPYNTKCKNYTKNVYSKGDACQRNCFLRCQWETYFRKCGCIHDDVSLLADSKKCAEKDHSKCHELSPEQFNQCDAVCPTDCLVELYDIVKTSDGIKSESTAQGRAFTKVKLDLKTTRQVLYQHEPRFTIIEVFGYVGGYFSVWLGLSFTLIYDYAEGFLLCLSRRRELLKMSQDSQSKTSKVELNLP